MNTLAATAHIVIHVVPSYVWDAITDAKVNEHLLLQCTATTDWEAGSKITFTPQHEQGNTTGEVLTSNAPHDLTFTFPITNDSEQAHTVISYHLVPDRMKTRVDVIQSGFAATPEGKVLKEVADKHWQEALHKLRNQLEKDLLSFP